MEIRPTSQIDAIAAIHARAFGKTAGPEIARLVEDLFDDPSAEPRLSLAAFEKETMIGHILFTRARLTRPETPLSVSILAPLAVLPEFWGQGVGLGLIRAGLDRLKILGTDLVFVLGHPGYYPRAGFSPAGARGLFAPYPIPEKDAGAWMVQDLTGRLLGRVAGTVACARAMDRPEHWRE